MPVLRQDPYPGFNFQVEFSLFEGGGDSLIAGFSEVSGLEIVQPMIAYRNGNDPTLAPRLLPGLVDYAPLVLRRGLIGSELLWDWMKQSVQGKPEPANGVIKLLDEARVQVMSWKIRNAQPTRLVGPTLDAAANAIALETLELRHTGLELDD